MRLALCTLHPMPAFLPQDSGIAIDVSRAHGAFLFDTAGRQFIDFDNGKGTTFLGHADPEIQAAVTRALGGLTGVSSMPGSSVRSVAQRLTDCTGMESVAFYRTGSAAVYAGVHALRVQRQRSLVLSCGYHGYEDFWEYPSALVEPNKFGVLDFYYDLDLMKEMLERHSGRIACAVVSPDRLYLTSDWYASVYLLLSEHNVPIIADEVKVGLRYGPQLLTKDFGWSPQLAVLSKTLSNGLPLAALLGDTETLSHLRYWRSTSWAEPSCFAAAEVALSRVIADGGLQTRIKLAGNRFIARCNEHFKNFSLPIEIVGDGLMFYFVFASESMEKEFYFRSLKEGLLFYDRGYQAPSAALTDEIFEAASSAVGRVSDHLRSSATARNCCTDLTTEHRLVAAWKLLEGVAPFGSPIERQHVLSTMTSRWLATQT